MRPSLSELFLAHDGRVSDKWEQYLAIYDRELARFRDAAGPVRLLEIGVQNGGSLELWSKYLPPGSSVVGMDIDPRCGALTFAGDITVLVGDAADPATLDRLLGDRGFDIIIDDGSHVSRDIIATFEACFPRLAPGGLFLIEDLHASYWASHGGGFRAEGAAVEWLKGLVDALHADHLEPTVDGAMRSGLLALNQQVARVAFYDSVAVVEKLPQVKAAPWRRIMGGMNAAVEDSLPILLPVAAARNEQVLLTPVRAESVNGARQSGVADADAERQRHAQAEARLAARVEELERSLADQAAVLQRLSTIEDSTIWRATAPYRRLMGLFGARRG
ncbi:class I SAM-dependent methyltransferase [Roseomonas sp. CECT 9278]|uniref:class I SAM-dependent methyltransferase n=1 Tax=Roseomonas sp. CECT 9278 TaxID=2845823 RepID=UPI001E4635F7|nr:class I SAM-dependent methyltransferase [Roseomonas sp. CECT 9278]CAH0194090.1 hypothetical protein ROS9278_01757 [Roseomonas sp. CECT 9278]